MTMAGDRRILKSSNKNRLHEFARNWPIMISA